MEGTILWMYIADAGYAFYAGSDHDKTYLYRSSPCTGRCQYNRKHNERSLDWDTYAYPVYVHSTARIVGAANPLGYACIGVSDESMMERACQVAQNMPIYPATGSVYDAGEFVVVKLSE